MVCLVLSINCTDQSVCYQAKKSNFYAKHTRLHSLGRDTEMRYMPEGKAVAALSLATSEAFKDRCGNRQERTEWHRVVLFGKTAEVADDYTVPPKESGAGQ